MSAADPARHLVMPWLTYLPALDAPGDIVARLRRARRKADERHGLYKVIVRRSFLDTPDAQIDAGNHRVREVDASAPVAHEALPGESPRSRTYRSAASASSRRRSRSAPRVAAGRRGRQTVVVPLARGVRCPRRRPAAHARAAVAIAANYSVGAELRVDPGDGAVVEDPFLHDIALRYTPSRPPNPLARILTFGERVAAEVARTTGGL